MAAWHRINSLIVLIAIENLQFIYNECPRLMLGFHSVRESDNALSNLKQPNKNPTSKMSIQKQPNRITGSILSLALFLLAFGQAYGVREPDQKDLPPPMPETMPALPPGQKPEVEPLPQQPPAHTVGAKDLERVGTLFKENGLSLENLRVTRIISLPKNPAHVSVEVQLHHHNLPVSDAYEMFRFLNDKLRNPESRENLEKRLKALADSEIPGKPTITRWQAIEGLRQHVRLDPMRKGEAEGEVEARLLIANAADREKPEMHLLAWEVSIKNAGITATINATSGKMLSYSNAINH